MEAAREAGAGLAQSAAAKAAELGQAAADKAGGSRRLLHASACACAMQPYLALRGCHVINVILALWRASAEPCACCACWPSPRPSPRPASLLQPR